MEARIQWSNQLKVLKEKENLYSVKISFKNEDDIKTFSDLRKRNKRICHQKSCTTRNTKNNLQAGGNDTRWKLGSISDALLMLIKFSKVDLASVL